jgi:hypothetical protein
MIRGAENLTEALPELDGSTALRATIVAAVATGIETGAVYIPSSSIVPKAWPSLTDHATRVSLVPET